MHPADSVELAHGGVHDGVASAALGPSFEVFVIVLPLNIAVFGFEWFVHAEGISYLA